MASTNFINECKNRTNKNRLGKITLIDDNIEINNSNNLKNFIIENSCYSNGNIIGTIFVKKLTSEFVGLSDNVDLIDKKINVQAGVKYANTTTEFVNLGRYIVERPTDLQTSDKDKIIAYDYLSDKLEDEYECNLDYSNNNITVSDLYIDVCNQLNLIPVTTTFLNSNITIQNNPFKNHEKNRTVLNAVATVACSFVTVDMDNNKIDLSWLSSSIEPEYTFEKNDYSILEGGKIVYGPINSVTIKNSQIDDENVTQTDSESIALNGEHSIIISEDYILYNTTLRQQAITGIFNRLDGLRYTDCKLTTYYGKPFMKIGTKIRVRTDNGYFDTYVLSHKFSYDGSFVSEISSPALTEQEIKTKQNRTLGKLLSDTQIQIDKQKQQILANVTSIQQVNQKANTLETNLQTTNSNLATTNTNLNNLQTQVNGISADFDDFYDNEYIQSIDNLQSQIDGQIQFWNGPDIPTINNYPTNQWTTEADKNNHRADIYTVIEDVQGELKQGKSYRFDKVNNVWQWIELTDNELSAVQAIANEANNRSKANASDITVLQEQDATFQMNLNSIDARVTNNETTIQEILDTEDTKTGNPITTEEALANKLLDFEIEGNSYQESYSGKNLLFFTSNTSYGVSSNISNNDTLELSITGEATSTGGYVVARLNSTLKPGTYTMTISKALPFLINLSLASGVSFRIPAGATSVTTTINNTYSSGQLYMSMTKDIVYNSTFSIQLVSGTNPDYNFEKYVGGISAPNPDYPQNIDVVTGNCNLKINNENLLQEEFRQGNTTNTTVTNRLFTVNSVKVKKGKTYTISTNLNTSSFLYYLRVASTSFPASANIYSGNSISSSSTTYTATSDGYLGIMISKVDTTSTISVSDISDYYFQVEEGSTATPYKPYQSQKYEINLGKNLFDKDNQVRVQVNEIGTLRYGIIVDAPNKKVSISAKNWNNSIALKSLTNGTYGQFLNINSNMTLNVVDKLIIYATSDTNKLDYNIEELQIEIGNITSYSPYFTPIEFCKIGEYKDKLRKSTGKQLFNKNNYNLLDGFIRADNYQFSSSSTNRSTYVKVNPNTTYTISGFSLNVALIIGTYSNVPNYGDIANIRIVKNATETTKTITTGTNDNYLVFMLQTSSASLDTSLFQIEEGFQATDIEPYGKDIWYKLKKIGKIDLSSVSWNTASHNIQTRYYTNTIPNIKYVSSNTQVGNGLAEKYKIVKGQGISLVSNCLAIDVSIVSVCDNSSPTGLFYYALANPTYEVIENQELIDTLNNIELFEGINNISFESNIDTEFMIKYLLKTPFTDNYMTRTETEAEINIKANQILEKVQEVSDETTSINQRVQNLSETTSTISTNLNNNYQTADATNAQIQTTKDDITQIQSQISEVRQSLTDFNISLSTMSGTLNNMSYNFNTDRLKIAKTNDPINSELSNQGVKIYNYSTLSAIFTNKGSGIDKLIVTGTAQIGYLKIVKSYKNNKKCTTIHVLNQLIEDLEDLESDN